MPTAMRPTPPNQPAPTIFPTALSAANYQNHSRPIWTRSAIERISEAEARQKLAAAMYLELGVRRR